mmetsp:Transcript_13573/g.1987  ORF Transcript_13573/g.1987 Transcript_13573/m.1987 type:complete len:160 (-) Transcript_13573:21-500(-)
MPVLKKDMANLNKLNNPNNNKFSKPLLPKNNNKLSKHPLLKDNNNSSSKLSRPLLLNNLELNLNIKLKIKINFKINKFNNNRFNKFNKFNKYNNNSNNNSNRLLPLLCKEKIVEQVWPLREPMEVVKEREELEVLPLTYLIEKKNSFLILILILNLKYL